MTLEETALKAALHNNRAHCYVQLYDPVKVIDESSKCLQIEPYNLKALLRRAGAYESTEKHRAALNGACEREREQSIKADNRPALTFLVGARQILNKWC